MNTEKIQTLEQLLPLIDTVTKARAKKNLTDEQQEILENAAITLRNVERTIIKKQNEQLIDALKADSEELNKLADQIKASAAELEKVSEAVGKAAQLVNLLINVASTIVTAGLAG